GLLRRSTVAAERAAAVVFEAVWRIAAGDAGHDAGQRVDAADTVVVRVGDQHVAAAVEHEIVRLTQQRGARRTAVAGETARRKDGSSGVTMDDAVRVDAPDGLFVDEIEQAVRSELHPHGSDDGGAERRALFVDAAERAAPGVFRDHAAGDAVDPVRVAVDEEEVARRT